MQRPLTRRSLLRSALAAPGLILPSEATAAFVSFGASRTLSNEPPLSAMEETNGLTNTVFFDHFDNPNVIDTANAFTFAPPFKWASSYYSNAVTGITMADSILRIAYDPGNSGGHCLDTMGVKNGAVTGWGFTGSAALSVALKCDPSTAHPVDQGGVTAITWPAFWSLAKSHYEIGLEQQAGMTCARADMSTPKHMEFDFVELGFPYPAITPTPQGQEDSILFALNYWEIDLNLSRPYPICDWGGEGMPNPNASTRPSGFNFNEFNVYTTIYLHPNDNGGNGSIKRYITRPGGSPFHVTNCDHTWAAGTPKYTLIDTNIYPLVIGAGAGFPGEFDWVLVRQKP